MLHVGTLLALLVYFWGDWLRLVAGRLRGDPRPLVPGRSGPSAGLAAGGRHDPGRARRVPLDDPFENAIREPGLVAVTLVIGAAVLWLADRWGGPDEGRRRTSRSRWPIAIGAAQALALFPGISRSGITIVRPLAWPVWTARRPRGSRS